MHCSQKKSCRNAIFLQTIFFFVKKYSTIASSPSLRTQPHELYVESKATLGSSSRPKGTLTKSKYITHTFCALYSIGVYFFLLPLDKQTDTFTHAFPRLWDMKANSLSIFRQELPGLFDKIYGNTYIAIGFTVHEHSWHARRQHGWMQQDKWHSSTTHKSKQRLSYTISSASLWTSF